MTLSTYMLQTGISLMLAWVVYRLAFSTLSFHRWNRYYLLASILFSFLLPVIELPLGSPVMEAVAFQGIDWTFAAHIAPVPATGLAGASGWPLAVMLRWFYWSVTVFLLLRLLWRWQRFRSWSRRLEPVHRVGATVFVHDRPVGSFTVWRRIYLHRDRYYGEAGPVFRHELVHARQLHSLDLFIMDFVGAFCWFNPFVFLLHRSVKENLEFLADAGACNSRQSLGGYLMALRQEAIRRSSPAFANPFGSVTIKNRIIMLTNQKSKHSRKLRYLIVIPLLSVLILAFGAPVKPSLAAPADDQAFFPMVLTIGIDGDGSPSIFPLPAKYREKITWGFNQKARHPITKKEVTHMGIDIVAPTGTEIVATAEGKVEKAEVADGYGKYVVISHSNGFVSVYAHMDSYYVEAGATVSKGQMIGTVGNTGQSTGAHLHYEVRLNGKQVDPADYY